MYDENGNVVAMSLVRSFSTPAYSELYEYNKKNQLVKKMTSCAGTFGEVCGEILYTNYNKNGEKISQIRKINCVDSEDKCEEYRYYYYNAQNEIENTIYKLGCSAGEDKCEECRDNDFNIIECPKI